ncbi:MAG: hypothetical protein PWQ82_1789 [Thermosediminibacterales bacterium]|nr:hypothetical protein [Thermosediminibacterales bacterium]MDK2836265.1 hypothetical protein [Thermosediminibacterales bacterium]
MVAVYNEPEIIERAKTPRGEIQLQKRGSDYEIIFNGIFIMATYNGRSEKNMIELALKHLEKGKPKRLLIGGLGAGFTLQAALEHNEVKSVDVVEVEKKIIDWNRSYFDTFNNNALEDPRINMIEADFKEYIINCRDKYDLIAVDIDNGPDWVVMESNSSIYDVPFLQEIKQRLISGGLLAIWSATYNKKLFESLGEVFNNVEIERIEDKDLRNNLVNYYIYLSENRKFQL